MSTITFSTLRGPRIFEKIVEHIRDAILAGRLQPGDRLPPERELVRQFQVGRGAIREAFRILEQSGLIRIRAGNGGGAFVGGQPTEAVTRSPAELHVEIDAAALERLRQRAAHTWLEARERAGKADREIEMTVIHGARLDGDRADVRRQDRLALHDR